MRTLAPVLRALLLLALLTTGVPAPGGAQAGGTPTRADSAAVLLEAAQRFQAEEEVSVARALYRHIVGRFPGTPAAERAAALLEGVSATGSGSGSVELQVWSTLYGLWLGVAVPGALGADGSEAYGAGLLVGGPAGFLAGRLAARNRGYTLGQVRAITLGGSWGTWQGFGWREVLDLGVEEICPPEASGCFDGEDSAEEAFAGMVIGGLAGLATGIVVAEGGVSSAAATGANFGSLWGSWFGTAAGVLVDLEDDDLLAAALVGGNAGLLAGGLGTAGLGWSRDRWRLVSVAGLLGGLGGLGIDLLAQPDDEKVAVAIPLATSLVGLGIGIASSRGMGRSDEVDGPAAGALLGLGEGGLRLDAPVPYPTLRPVDGPRGTRWEPALGVTLFRAVF